MPKGAQWLDAALTSLLTSQGDGVQIAGCLPELASTRCNRVLATCLVFLRCILLLDLFAGRHGMSLEVGESELLEESLEDCAAALASLGALGALALLLVGCCCASLIVLVVHLPSSSCTLITWLLAACVATPNWAAQNLANASADLSNRIVDSGAAPDLAAF